MKLDVLAQLTAYPLILLGCASTSTVANAPAESAISVDITKPCAAVQEVLEPALIDLGFEIDSVEDLDACGRTIIAKKGMSAFSWGELVRVTLREKDSQSSALEIVTQRRLSTNITADGDWSPEIHEAVLDRLGKSE